MKMDSKMLNKFSLIKLRMLGFDELSEIEILDTISNTLYNHKNKVSSTYETYYDNEDDETYVWFNYDSFINKNLTKKRSKSFIKKTIKKFVDCGVLKRKTFSNHYKGRRTYITYGHLYDWITEYMYFYDEDCYARDCLYENIILTDKEYEMIMQKLKKLRVDISDPYKNLMYMNDLSEEINKSQTQIDNLCGYILSILDKYPQFVLNKHS